MDRVQVSPWYALGLFFSRPTSVSQQDVGLCDRIAVDGQVRPTQYGNDRRGASFSENPPNVL
jgi:hypothetical protein